MRMILTAIAMVGVSAGASAQTVVPLGSSANLTSAALDGFSDTFVRLNLLQDRYYQYSNSSQGSLANLASSANPSNIRTTVPGGPVFGAGAYFPNGSNFQIGTLTHTTGTGIGAETLPITSVSLNVVQDIDIWFGPYTSSFPLPVGSTVTRDNGILTAINIPASPITFSFDYTAFGAGIVNYSGSFGVSGNTFDLEVDQTNMLFGNPARYVWDADGVVNAVVPIPEPTWVGFVAILAIAARAQTRRRGAIVDQPRALNESQMAWK
jgi:hypothetical protein